jgi:hypothetical protein
MTAEEAHTVLRSLADGVDPETGVLIARRSVVQKPKVIRALHRALTVLRREVWRDKRRSQLPANTGQSSSAEEDARLIACFARGTSIDTMAELHLRTTGVVRARLMKLGALKAVS